jgi:hypothetical protein
MFAKFKSQGTSWKDYRVLIAKARERFPKQDLQFGLWECNMKRRSKEDVHSEYLWDPTHQTEKGIKLNQTLVCNPA